MVMVVMVMLVLGMNLLFGALVKQHAGIDENSEQNHRNCDEGFDVIGNPLTAIGTVDRIRAGKVFEGYFHF